MNAGIRKKIFLFLGDRRNLENFFRPVMSRVDTEQLNFLNYQLTMHKLIDE
jgi:hypothetical protein